MMQHLKKRIEIQLGYAAAHFYDNPIKTGLIVLCITFAFAFGTSKLIVESSTESLFTLGDATYANYNAFLNQFGQDSVAIAGIKSDAIFESEFLNNLRAYHLELEAAVPYLDKITSLYNITSIKGNEGELIVEDLMETFPQNKIDRKQLKHEVMNNPLYKNNIISADGKFTLIMIRADLYSEDLTTANNDEDSFDLDEVNDTQKKPANLPLTTIDKKKLTKKQKTEFVESVRKITQKYNSKTFPIVLSGSPVVEIEHIKSIRKDVGTMLGLAGVTMFILLYIIFRRASGVLFPMAIVSLTLASVFGIMGWLELPVTPVSQMFPSLILAIGIADAVHFLTLFYKEQLTQDNRTAVIYALQHSGLAMFFTSITTAAGFLSFSGANLLPIADLGIVTPLGVMLALLYTYTLLPALISLFSIKRKNQTKAISSLQTAITHAGNFAYQNPYKIIMVSVVIASVLSIGLFRISFSHNLVEWLPEDNAVRVSTETINKEMGATVSLEVIIDTGKENGLYNPVVMQKLDGINRLIESLNYESVSVTKSFSVVDTLKQINYSLNESDADYYSVPKDRKIIAQEMLLFENSGSDDLEELVDNQFSMARITVRIPWVDAVFYLPLREKIEEEFVESFEGYAKINVTGYMDLLTQSFMNVLQTMTNSYLIAFIVIGGLMLTIFGDLKLGLLSLAPNFFPIFVALSFMGLVGMPLDMFTVLMGGIALGLAVDDSVHFIHTFQRNYVNSGDVGLSIEQTLSTVGRAILFTTLTLAGAFLIYIFATVGNLSNLGFALVIAIVTALLCDIFLLPALLSIFYKKRLDC